MMTVTTTTTTDEKYRTFNDRPRKINQTAGSSDRNPITVDHMTYIYVSHIALQHYAYVAIHLLRPRAGRWFGSGGRMWMGVAPCGRPHTENRAR